MPREEDRYRKWSEMYDVLTAAVRNGKAKVTYAGSR
jgi:hypothetical protein